MKLAGYEVDNKVAAGAAMAALLVGVGGWYAYRSSQRKELMGMLLEDGTYQKATANGWISWDLQVKAAEFLPLADVNSVDQAYLAAMAEIRDHMPVAAVTEDAGLQTLAEDIGYKVWEKLPDIPGIDLESWWGK